MQLSIKSKRLKRIEKGQTAIMAAIDDLKAAVIRLNASTSAELKALADKLSQPNADEAAVAAAVVSLNQVSDNLDTETASLAGAPPVAGGPPAG